EDPFQFSGSSNPYDDIINITTEEAHTGEASIRVASYENTHSHSPIFVLNEEVCRDKLKAAPYNYNASAIDNYFENGVESTVANIPHILRTSTNTGVNGLNTPLPIECDCLGKFAPEAGKEYHVSAWVKESKNSMEQNDKVTYSKTKIEVRFYDASENEISKAEFYPRGKMVELWQPIKGNFIIPANTQSIRIYLMDLGTTLVGSFFDDIRIHPADANMQSFVYNQDDYLISAELDRDNYATFYIYDERRQLIKVKKETEEGIKTIQEGRQHTKYNANALNTQ
ncbi:MAG: hypothetical protein MK212_18440, partial [Saprospiraceae bacterium]|nr:hypothetical protein [Saprospiraceae bacterium]